MAEAGTHLQEAVALATRIGDRLTLLDCLDLSAHLCVATARWAGAVTLWAALAACADQRALIISPPDAHRRREALQNAARALGADRLREAEERGTAMTLETATEFAVLLISPDSGQPDAPDVPPGLAQLSARERELVILVAQGQTDAQIAGQPYISISTVRSHLDRIRDKTNCRRGADLTHLALRAGLA
jgi:DNA-binding CsgD family transcriptional regulator